MLHTPRPRTLLIALAGLVVLALMAEAALRFWLVAPAGPRQYTDYGWTEAPGTVVIHGDEGYSRSRLNSFGFDDDEPAADPRLRALLLGDSYGQSRQVARDEGFPRVAERLLPGLDVVNASRSGFSPLDFAAYLPALAARFHPDVVVVTLNDGDVDNLLASGYLGVEADEAVRRHREGDARRSPAAGSSAPLIEDLARRSALATFLHRRLTLLAHREQARLSAKFATPEASAATGRAVEGEGVDAPIPAAAADLLDGLYGCMAERSPRLIVLYIPNLVYGSDGCHNKWPHRRDFYRAFARRTGARWIDGTDLLCEAYARTGQPLHGFHNSRLGTGHLNARGHAVVGEAMARAIDEAGR